MSGYVGWSMIKLSELKAARAKMEPGPYTHATYEAPSGSVDIRGSRCTCDAPPEELTMCPMHEHIAEWVPIDTAVGIETTHAAADILIEIVETLKKLDRWHPEHGEISALRAQLDASLAKVEL